MKKLITQYAFDKTAKTVTLTGVTSPVIERVLMIVNVTDGIILYQFNDPAKGGTLAGNVLTLEYDTTGMDNTDKLEIFYDAPAEIAEGVPDGSADAQVVALRPSNSDRISFAKRIVSGVDSGWGSVIGSIGTGITVQQLNGNLVIATGTTANQDVIIRSLKSYVSGVRLKVRSQLSQRIANNNFFVELVDVLGDALAYTITSATNIDITIPNTTLTAENIGQSFYIGNIVNTSGLAISGRYPIAAVNGNVVSLTVAGFSTGTGTLSAFGMNYYHLVYDSTTATNAKFDTQRRGYNTGDTTITTQTTAAPGHLAVITGNDQVATIADQLLTSSTTIKQTIRASRDENVPDDIPLYLQIRVLNGTTNPATTTTWTIGYTSVENFANQEVSIADVRPMGTSVGLPAEILRSVTIPVSQSTGVSTTQWNAAGYAGILVIDVASAALTTTTTTAAITPGSLANIGVYAHSFNVVVTAVSGTTPTLDVGVEESIDNGTNWVRIYDFERITAAGAYTSPLIRAQYGTRYRYVQTVAGTTPSFTRAVNRVQHSQPGQHFRRFIDRSMAINTINSTTPVYNVEGLEMIELIASVGAITTTAPIIQLEGSETGISTDFYAIGTPVTAVASSAVRTMYSGELPKFVRARVSTAGVGATANYVAIKGMGRS